MSSTGTDKWKSGNLLSRGGASLSSLMHSIEIKLSDVHIFRSSSPRIHIEEVRERLESENCEDSTAEEFEGSGHFPPEVKITTSYDVTACSPYQSSSDLFSDHEISVNRDVKLRSDAFQSQSDYLSVANNRAWLRRRSDPGDWKSSPLMEKMDDITPSKEANRTSRSSSICSSHRLSNPRLMIIRSASPENSCESAGETGEASRLSPLCHPRWANRAKSLPMSSLLMSQMDSNGSVKPLRLINPSRAAAAASLSWDDDNQSGSLLCPPDSANSLSRRRRSVSVECSHLEAIQEEMGNSQKSVRRYSITAVQSD